MFSLARNKCGLLHPERTVMSVFKGMSTRHSVLLRKNMVTPKRHASHFLLPRCPTKVTAMSHAQHLQQQQRSITFRNIPASLLTASPLKRRLILAAAGGASLAVAVVLGPILLVGLGGIAAVVAFRLWRFKRQLLQQSSQGNGDWPDFLNAFIQQQQVFGKEQLQVQKEAVNRLEIWAQTHQGRDILIENGVHPDRVTGNVSMRGSSYSSTTVNNDQITEIKIELDLNSAPGAVLIAIAEMDKEGNMSLKNLKLVTSTNVLSIPLTINRQNQGGGRIIEGEFRDI